MTQSPEDPRPACRVYLDALLSSRNFIGDPNSPLPKIIVLVPSKVWPQDRLITLVVAPDSLRGFGVDPCLCKRTFNANLLLIFSGLAALAAEVRVVRVCIDVTAANSLQRVRAAAALFLVLAAVSGCPLVEILFV